MGRADIAYGILMGKTYGMRIEEVCKCQVNHLKAAVQDGELYIRGKNGQVRYLHLETDRQKTLTKELLEYAKENNRMGTDRVLYDNATGATQKMKKSLQNWISNHCKKFQDNSRENKEKMKELEARAVKKGVKLKTDTITFHGLRHCFAQERYKYYTKQGMSSKEARYRVSEALGHHRDAVTKIYLADS